ncbi:MAG: glycosyltransferase [Candidatus Woesebacteria bacterium]|jgi:glycosyltransferase involved in cell wall biosynthesis
MSKPKIAIVTDWLTNMGGAEHLLYSLHMAFPDAPIYTSVFSAEKCPQFKNLDVRTTYLQKLPRFLREKHQLFPVFRTRAFKKLNLNEYDVVISCASAEAKAVKARNGATHICYCHTPTRYYWSHYEEYKQNPGFGALDPIIKLLIPPFVKWMRKLDLESITGVDYFIANSHEVQNRIKKYYHKDSTVIFPPVETKRFSPTTKVEKQDYYLVAGRQTPYKRIDLAISTCNNLQKPLIVIGRGSEHQKLVAMAGPTVKFATNVSDKDMAQYFQRAKGFIFPSLEDFGIVPVEALAAGTPVVAFNKGGTLDYIKEGINGVFFDKQTPESVAKAVNKLEKTKFNSKKITEDAKTFDEEVFIKNMQNFVKSKTS